MAVKTLTHMLTLQLRGHKGLLLIAIAQGITLFSLSCGLTSAKETNPVAPVNKSEVNKHLPELVNVIAHNDLFPNDVKAKILPAYSNARRIRSSSTYMLVIPARITFKGLTNSYCRLFQIIDNKAALVGLPPNVDIDSCKRMKVIEADLNDDKLPDFIIEMTVKSNRYDADATEYAAYISKAHDETSGYCYSSTTTKLIESPLPLKASAAKAAIVANAKRLNKPLNDCYLASNK